MLILAVTVEVSEFADAGAKSRAESLAGETIADEVANGGRTVTVTVTKEAGEVKAGTVELLPAGTQTVTVVA